MLEQQPEEMAPDLRDYWRIVVQGRWYILIAFVVVVAATALFTFTADPVYEATGRVLVLTERGKALGEETTALPSSLSGNIRNEVPNWMEMMKSRSALEKAVAELKADPRFVELMRIQQARPSLWERWLGRYSAPAPVSAEGREGAGQEGEEPITVEELDKRISVQNVRGTDLIEIRATGGSPEEAQRIVNALLDAYRELDREITKTTLKSVQEFLDAQLQQTEASLRTLEEEFEAFKRKAGLELGLDPLEQAIGQLVQTRAQLEADLAEKQADLEGLEDRLDPLVQKLFAGTGAAGLTEEEQAQLAQLQGLEEERSQALQAGDFRRAEELEAQIAAVGPSFQGTPLAELLAQYQGLIPQQRDLYASIDALQGRLAALQERIDRETERLSQYRLAYNRFERDIQVTQNLYTLLREEYERARIADVGELGGIRVVSRAVEPEAPIKPKKKLNLLLAGLVGLMLGTGAAFLREYLDSTYKNPKQVERELGVPSLGVIFALEDGRVKAKEDRARQLERLLLTRLDTKDPYVNAHIGIEASLRFASVDAPLKTLLVTSAVPQEGKSSLAANLGLVFSHAGRSTVIVDSDLRKPIFYRVFGLDREVGLTSVALGQVELEEALICPYASPEGKAVGRGIAELLLHSGKISRKDLEEALKVEQREGWRRSLEEILIDQGKLTPEELAEIWARRREGLENFYVLPPGPLPPNPADFYGSERMANLVEQLKGRFDVVIFDSSPVLSAPDALMLGAQTDGTILAVQAGSTDRAPVEQAVEQLRKAGAKLVGTVLTRVKAAGAGYYGGYHGYYYGYYYGYHGEESDRG